MKGITTIALILISVLTLSGCAIRPVHHSSVKEDKAYLTFVSQDKKKLKGKVKVKIDNGKSFDAKVTNSKHSNSTKSSNIANNTKRSSRTGSTKSTNRTNNTNRSSRKGNTYEVETGRKRVTVEKDGKVIYDKEVNISAKETKQITLP